MPCFDIVIVGGGLAGTSLALALTQLTPSLRIAIIEAKPHIQLTTNDKRTLVLSYGSACIYENLKLWSTLQSYAYPLHDLHISERFSFAATRFRANEYDVPALGYVIPLIQLQTQLYDAIANNVTWYCPDCVTELTYDDDNVQLQLQQAGCINSKLVIAADGAQSTIRQLVNIGVDKKDYSQHALITSVTLNSAQHTAYKRFTKEGSFALLPTAPKQAGLVWITDPNTATTYQTAEETVFLKHIQRLFGYRAGKFLTVEKRQVFPLQLLQARSDTAKQVILIGHAAHALHPTAAQGFNLSLRDVATLADIICQSIDQDNTLNENIAIRYQQQRKIDQRNTVKLTDLLARLFHPDLTSLRLVRGLGLLACDVITPLKSRLARQSMGMMGNVPLKALQKDN